MLKYSSPPGLGVLARPLPHINICLNGNSLVIHSAHPLFVTNLNLFDSNETMENIFYREIRLMDITH